MGRWIINRPMPSNSEFRVRHHRLLVVWIPHEHPVFDDSNNSPNAPSVRLRVFVINAGLLIK